MKKKPEPGREGRALVFWLLMAASTLVAGWLAFFWYISPLTLGFSDWPDDPERRRLVLRLYDLSWHWGIPALLVAQASALVLACWGRRVAAELIAVLANLGFAALIGMVIALIS